jgi:hypothetical protein
MKYQIYQGDWVSHKIFPPVEGVVISGGYNDFLGVSKLVVQREDGSIYQDNYDTWELVEHFIENENELQKEDSFENSSGVDIDTIDAEFTIID